MILSEALGEKKAAGIVNELFIRGEISLKAFFSLMFDAQKIPEKIEEFDGVLETLFKLGIISKCGKRRLYGVFIGEMNLLSLYRTPSPSFAFEEKFTASLFLSELKRYLSKYRKQEEARLMAFNPEKKKWVSVTPTAIKWHGKQTSPPKRKTSARLLKKS